MVSGMVEVDPDILAQLHRIHRAVNDGTLDRDTVNDALRLIHDILSGALAERGQADEATGRAEPEDVGNGGPTGAEEERDEGGEDHPAKRRARKRR